MNKQAKAIGQNFKNHILYNKIFEDSLNELYIFDVETLHFIQVNRGARKNLGYSMKEFYKLTPLDIKPEFTKKSFEKLIKLLKNKEKEKVEFCAVHQRKDGSTYPVEVHLQFFTLEKSSVFVAIILDITERKRMEIMIKSLTEKHAQEKERERISREIHDDLGQALATLKIFIQSSQRGFYASESHSKVFKKTIHYLDMIIEKTRNIAASLSPPTLELLGLSSALRAMVNEFRYIKGLSIRLRSGKLDNIVFEGDRIHLYRIVQEALTNIIKHAEATEVDIVLKKLKSVLALKIVDNGKGFECHKDKRCLQRGLGLSTMEGRAHLLGGSFELKSEKGKGTIINVNVPVEEA